MNGFQTVFKWSWKFLGLYCLFLRKESSARVNWKSFAFKLPHFKVTTKVGKSHCKMFNEKEKCFLEVSFPVFLSHLSCLSSINYATSTSRNSEKRKKNMKEMFHHFFFPFSYHANFSVLFKPKVPLWRWKLNHLLLKISTTHFWGLPRFHENLWLFLRFRIERKKKSWTWKWEGKRFQLSLPLIATEYWREMMKKLTTLQEIYIIFFFPKFFHFQLLIRLRNSTMKTQQLQQQLSSVSHFPINTYLCFSDVKYFSKITRKGEKESANRFDGVLSYILNCSYHKKWYFFAGSEKREETFFRPVIGGCCKGWKKLGMLRYLWKFLSRTRQNSNRNIISDCSSLFFCFCLSHFPSVWSFFYAMKSLVERMDEWLSECRCSYWRLTMEGVGKVIFSLFLCFQECQSSLRFVFLRFHCFFYLLYCFSLVLSPCLFRVDCRVEFVLNQHKYL